MRILRYYTLTMLALLLAAVAFGQLPKVASNNAMGPNGSLIGRNFPTNWLYVPVDANGYLLVTGMGGGGGGGGGNAITALTGDVTATGPGSVAASVKMIGGGSLNFTGPVQMTAGVASLLASFNISGSGQVGTTFAAGLEAIAFSATPVFNGTMGNTHYLTLAGNVTSSSFVAAPANASQQFKICQDGTGGRTFSWPTNFAGFPSVTLAASGCTTAIGFYDLASDTVWGDQYNTANCVNSAASNVPCGAATRGYIAVPAGTNSTLAVLTSAIGTASGVVLTASPGASSLLGVTCNTTPLLPSYAWTPGTSFTVTANGTATTNPSCYFWSLVNP